MSKSKRGIEKVDFGLLIHTALRKCCDSDITSIAYNMVHALDAAWSEFLDALWKGMLKREFNVGELYLALNRLRKGFNVTRSSGYRALVLLFLQFGSDDMAAAFSYVIEEEDSE